ncbi:uncharacterized protein TrAtP1_000071 [Trichoderma atroviride]|uniref:uncharacterized protein n=1 Tax=Hypocrea atroviridis TaxID=63577 RepID=UPI00332B56FF|nr:hypothetical protein TrAtP1_000071 [Trichoderma atroviride]
MKHTFSSLAALALTLSTSAVASPEPQLLVPGIIDTVECIAVNVIAELIIGDPLAIAFCEAVVPPTKSVIKTSFTTVVTPTTVTATISNNNRIRPTITSRTIVTTTSSLCTPKPFPTPFKRHHLPPIPNRVAQFPTPDVTKACSCLSLPIPTTTVTRTVTINPVIAETKTVGSTGILDPVVTTSTITRTQTVRACPAPTLCGNQGIEFAYYAKTVGGEFSDFHPEAYKLLQPRYQATTNCIGGISFQDSADKSIYGSPPLPESNFVLNHRGYIYARQTGAYTFTLDKVDDAAFLWVGGVAFSGWAAANANLKVVYNNGPAQGTYTVNLQEGRYYPFRIFYGQGPRIAEFDINVKAPDGTTFLSSNRTGSPYLVRFSCDGFTAPRFDHDPFVV